MRACCHCGQGRSQSARRHLRSAPARIHKTRGLCCQSHPPQKHDGTFCHITLVEEDIMTVGATHQHRRFSRLAITWIAWKDVMHLFFFRFNQLNPLGVVIKRHSLGDAPFNITAYLGSMSFPHHERRLNFEIAIG